MNCPKCGKPVEHHDASIWREARGVRCELMEPEATRLAQRRKAAERYNAESLKWPWKDWELYLLALTDTGILAPGETVEELLKELEGESK